MLKQAITLLFLAAILVPQTLGRPDGAPVGACATMQPVHYGSSTQTSASPYSIGLTVSEYTPGTKVAVTINGADFKGILLQARKSGGSDTTPVGTFSDVPADTKLTKCTADDDSFTHANTNVKNGIIVQWNPPSEAVGEVKFYATVAEEKTKYWKGIESAALTVQAPKPESVGTSDAPKPEGGTTEETSGTDSPKPEGGTTEKTSSADSAKPKGGTTEETSSTGVTEKSVMLFTAFVLVLGAGLRKLF